MKQNLEKFKIKLIAYVIMGNHVHMCVYHKKIENLSAFMHDVNSKFATYYNYQENRVGYVFKNRFYSQEIYNRQQLFNTIAYIHNNPRKANLVNQLEEYQYSSYRKYIKNQIENEILLLVFQSLDYKKVFHFIHKNYSEIGIKDIVEETTKEPKVIVQEFLLKNHISLEIVKQEKNLLVELVRNLKIEGNMSNKKIGEMLDIDKNRMTRINKKLLEF